MRSSLSEDGLIVKQARRGENNVNNSTLAAVPMMLTLHPPPQQGPNLTEDDSNKLKPRHHDTILQSAVTLQHVVRAKLVCKAESMT